jgi:hypothetical protein
MQLLRGSTLEALLSQADYESSPPSVAWAAAIAAQIAAADVPAELDTLVSSMLAKDPGARPTAAAVHEALLPLTATEPGPGGTGAAGIR